MTVKLEDGNLNRLNKITEIANLDPTYCKENDTLGEVVDKAISLNHRRLPVISKGNRMTGIVTYMDILDAIMRGQKPDVKISSIMTRDVVSAGINETIEHVFQVLKMSRRGGMPILHSHILVGLITERDFVKRFSDVPFEVKIKETMSHKPLVIPSRHLSILNALKSLVNTRYRRLPIVENGKVVGIVTSYDMISYLHHNSYDFSALDKPLEMMMNADVCSVSGERDVSEAIRLMKTKDVGGILVIDDDKLEGIITERDIFEQIS